ncbi:MAG TPA: C4-dicarboxylate ABC transporter, partial [Halomonas sp.]|nr:C4-dicarboxylate ABC transporter [Halomonas sp.]
MLDPSIYHDKFSVRRQRASTLRHITSKGILMAEQQNAAASGSPKKWYQAVPDPMVL